MSATARKNIKKANFEEMKKRTTPYKKKKKTPTPYARPQRSLLVQYNSGKSLTAPVYKRNDQGAFSTNAVTNSAISAVLLSAIATGDSDTQRDGLYIRLKSIRVRFVCSCSPQATAVHVASLARIIIFYDKAPRSAAATYADVVFNNITGTSLVTDPISYRNKERFLILRDKTYSLPGFSVAVAAAVPTYTADQQPNINASDAPFEDFYKNLKCELDIQYNNTQSTVGAINTGGIFYVIQGTLAASPWFFSVTSSTMYTDSKN